MSDGLRDAIKEFWKISDETDKQSLMSNNSIDKWDDDEITQIIDKLNKSDIKVKNTPWLDSYEFWKPRQCDCGAEIAKTTHANWCSKGNRS